MTHTPPPPHCPLTHRCLFALVPSLLAIADRAVKAGYPPHSLTLIPELPLESLGLKQGEQLIVTQKSEAHRAPTSSAAARTQAPAPAVSSRGSATLQVHEPAPPRASAPSTSGPDYVETDSGFLVHRVRMLPLRCWSKYLSKRIHSDRTGR